MKRPLHPEGPCVRKGGSDVPGHPVSSAGILRAARHVMVGAAVRDAAGFGGKEIGLPNSFLRGRCVAGDEAPAPASSAGGGEGTGGGLLLQGVGAEGGIRKSVAVLCNGDAHITIPFYFALCHAKTFKKCGIQHGMPI